jgi:hypothetical protein
MKAKPNNNDEKIIQALFGSLKKPSEFQSNKGDNPIHPNGCMCGPCYEIWKLFGIKKK